jgi:hypothetical protein
MVKVNTDSLLGSCAVYYFTCLHAFQRNTLPPSSEEAAAMGNIQHKISFNAWAVQRE